MFTNPFPSDMVMTLATNPAVAGSPRADASREGISSVKAVPPIPLTAAQVEQRLNEQASSSYKPTLPIFTLNAQHQVGWYFYQDADAMLEHASVAEPLENIAAIAQQAEFEVTSNSKAAAAFIEGQIHWFWRNAIAKVQEIGYGWGWIGGEMVYTVEGGLLVQKEMIGFGARDVRPLTIKGEYCGLRLQQSREGKVPDLWGPRRGLPSKGFWYAHRPRAGMLFGRSQAKPAWRLWRRLSGRDGWEDCYDLAGYRESVGIYEIGFPSDDVKATRQPSGPARQSNRDQAQEMGENLKAGGAIQIPTETHTGSNASRWHFKHHSMQTHLGEIQEAVDFMYNLISKAIGWKPELTEAAETGSGFSGRAIPLQACLMAQQVPADAMCAAWVKQIGEPLAKWNFGKHVWVKVIVKPLLETYRKVAQGNQGAAGVQQPGAQQPQPPQSDGWRGSMSRKGRPKAIGPDGKTLYGDRAERALAKKGGSGTTTSDTKTLATAHAPAGGIAIAGKQFAGGEFIPSEVMAQATEEEKAKLTGATDSSRQQQEQQSSTSAPANNKQPEHEEIVDYWMNHQQNAHVSAKKRELIGDELKNMLGSMPDKMLAAALSRLKGIRLHENLAEVTKDFFSEEDDPERLKKFTEEGKVIGGFYHIDRQDITVDYDDAGEAQWAYEVYAHEFGHVIDGPMRSISTSRAWKKAFAEEINVRNKKGEAPISEYSTTNEQEGFAEYILSYLVYPTEAQQYFPQCYAVLKKEGLV